MANTRALCALLTAHLFLLTHADDPFGTCDNQFIMFKHTVASSDSLRDCAMLYAIFPDIHDEGADKFHQGECAYQCKMELPYTCFKLHAPQTAFDEGLLHIDTFERKMSEKWRNALNSHNHGDRDGVFYDTFFDLNIAFWVKSLDEYIQHWQSQQAEVTLEYFGIEWNLPDDLHIDGIDDNKFYSILLHSPESAANFEFISQTKPAEQLYSGMQWTTDNIPRATFKLQADRYPWNREDAASIVPIRISHATTNIDKMYDFYHNILYADLLYYASAVGEQEETRTIFMGLLNTHIELQFTQRAATATYGAFSLEIYESLLMETHDTIITSPYCGQDRWMDNHYAYSTWTIPGLMDKIYANLNYNGIKYKVGKNVYEHASVHTKYQLDLVGYDGDFTFGLWVIEPGGQSIKIGGIITIDAAPAYYAAFGDPQWCQHACSWGLLPGTVDAERIYSDADDLRSNELNRNGKDRMEFVNGDLESVHVYEERETMKKDVVFLMCAFCVVMVCGMWWYFKRKSEEASLCCDQGANEYVAV